MNRFDRFADRHFGLANTAVLLCFLLLTMTVGWRVLSPPDTPHMHFLIGDDPDVHINPWADWWTQKALTDPDISLWSTDYLFYPQGANLSYHSFSHLTSAVSLGLRPFLGAQTAYNATILSYFVLAAWAMFHLAHYLTGSATAGVLAGFVFAFNSHSQYQSAHPVLAVIWVLPWATLFFLQAVERRRYRELGFALVFVLLAAVSSLLMVIILALWFAFLVAYMWLKEEWNRPSFAQLGVFVVGSAVMTLPAAWPLLQEAFFSQNTTFLIGSAQRPISMPILGLFIPHYSGYWEIRGLYLGLVGILMVGIAWRHRRPETNLWLILLIIAYLFAIGPTPIVDRRLPLATIENIFVWSWPITLLLRNMYRLNILIGFALGMLVAWGWISLHEEADGRWRKRTLTAVVCGLLLVEYVGLEPFPRREVDVSSFYTTEIHQLPPSPIATIPHGRQIDKRYLYYQSLHDRPITGGVISRSGADTFDFIIETPLLAEGIFSRGSLNAADMTMGDPRDLTAGDVTRSLQTLRANDIRLLVIHKNLTFAEDIPIWKQLMPMEPIYEDELLIAYQLEE